MSTITSGKSKVGVGVIVGVRVIVGVNVSVGVLVCVAVGTGDGVNDGDGLGVLVAVKVAEGIGVGELSEGSWSAHPDTIVSASIDNTKKTTLIDIAQTHLDKFNRSMNLQCLTS